MTPCNKTSPRSCLSSFLFLNLLCSLVTSRGPHLLETFTNHLAACRLHLISLCCRFIFSLSDGMLNLLYVSKSHVVLFCFVLLELHRLLIRAILIAHFHVFEPNPIRNEPLCRSPPLPPLEAPKPFLVATLPCWFPPLPLAPL